MACTAKGLNAVNIKECSCKIIHLRDIDCFHDPPFQVAISNSGTIYVSDGYCNQRVAQFSPEGKHQGDFVLADGAMNVPHSVLLHECSNSLYVADRENSRVHQFDLSTREYKGGTVNPATKEGRYR